MLEEAGIITVDDDTVALTADWLQALENERELTGEIDSVLGEGADTIERRRYKLKSKAFREWIQGRYQVSEHWTNNPDADGSVEDLHPATEPEPEPEPEPVLSPLAVAIRAYLDRNPQDACQPPGWIGRTLWAYSLHPKTTSSEVKAAIEELGGERYLRDLLRGEGAA